MLAGDGHGDADHHEDPHRGEEGPALADAADHLPEREGQGRRDPQDGEHLEEVGDRRGVLEWMCGVDIEEPASIGPELLDSDLTGDRPSGKELLEPLEPIDREKMSERLRDTL